MIARNLLNTFLDHLATLLLLFGLALLSIGVAVQASRYLRVRGMAGGAGGEAVPRFEDTLRQSREQGQTRQVAPALSPEPTVDPASMPLPDRIVVPSIELDARVVEVGWEARIVNGVNEGNVWQTADYAAGYHRNSVPPGVPGNTVISGHNNLRGAVFQYLHNIENGDRIYVFDVEGRRYAYDVAEHFVVREEGASDAERRDNTHWIRRTPDERLTLVTCFPPWTNTHRVIVVAFPAEDDAVDGEPGVMP